MTISKTRNLRVLELFGGIGACSSALERIGIPFEVVDYVEIDKYAVKSFNAIRGTDFEPSDIRTWDKDIECDLIMHGSPCQDFSVAGRGAGGDEGSGTRSSLMYETLRIVEKLKPKYVIWENVRGVLSKRHRHNFDAYQDKMAELGYSNFYKILNAKNYGVPQNMERVFMISILGNAGYDFPDPISLERHLRDILESEVDDKYYLSDQVLSSYTTKTRCMEALGNGFRFLPKSENDDANTISTKAGSRITDSYIKIAGNVQVDGWHESMGRVYDADHISPTLGTMQGGNLQPKIIDDTYKNRVPRESTDVSPTLRSGRNGFKVSEPFIVASRGRDNDGITLQNLEPRLDGSSNTITTVQKDNYIAIRQATKKGYDEAYEGDGIDLSYPASKTRRGRVQHGMSQTVTASNAPSVMRDFRIRKLTPRESWRLMGFDDIAFDKASAVNSNTQLYKQAGNSIVVDVLVAILSNLLNSEKALNNT